MFFCVLRQDIDYFVHLLIMIVRFIFGSHSRRFVVIRSNKLLMINVLELNLR